MASGGIAHLHIERFCAGAGAECPQYLVSVWLPVRAVGGAVQFAGLFRNADFFDSADSLALTKAVDPLIVNVEHDFWLLEVVGDLGNRTAPRGDDGQDVRLRGENEGVIVALGGLAEAPGDANLPVERAEDRQLRVVETDVTAG